MDEPTRESVVNAARAAAEKAGGAISRADFERISGISDHYIYRLFPEGGWSEVRRLAGLAKHPRYHPRMSDDDLLAEYHRVVCLLGEIPTWPRFEAEANVSKSVIWERFGGLRGTLERYLVWVTDNDPTNPVLPTVRDRCRQPHVPVSSPPPRPAATSSAPATEWQRSAGREYGPPVDFRGLRHEPVNEQGVVYLFGLVSRDLGFLVEAIGAAYPDCEAKRCVDQRRGRWQRVSIEFEYRSSNFREHGHETAGCDLIVCWDHDWHDCPVEVIELRSVIADLPK
jgi:hypothetical protein